MQGQLQRAAQEWASLFTNLPLQKWLTMAPRWITVVMVLLVAKSAADMTWLIFTPDETSGTTARSRMSAGRATQSIQHRIRTVANLHLFGVATRQKVVTNAPIEARETGLKLTLRGVFAAQTPALAMAIVANARGKEKVYKKGETIFSGVTLYEIYPDRVILERSGSFETLSLPKDKSSSKTVSRSNSRNSRMQPRQSNIRIRTRNIRAGSRIKNLRKELTQNPQKFMQEARIEPVFGPDNQIKGYKFEHKNKRIVSALGLRPGDIIIEINGQPVSDPSTLTSLFTQLGSMSNLTLAIERNGRRENLNIQM